MSTRKPTTAQIALLDQIASKGFYTAKQRRTAEILKKNGWIEQRPAPADLNWPAYMHNPYFLTDAGSEVREAAQQ